MTMATLPAVSPRTEDNGSEKWRFIDVYQPLFTTKITRALATLIINRTGGRNLL
jgi:hypothetical protein